MRDLVTHCSGHWYCVNFLSLGFCHRTPQAPDSDRPALISQNTTAHLHGSVLLPRCSRGDDLDFHINYEDNLEFTQFFSDFLALPSCFPFSSFFFLWVPGIKPLSMYSTTELSPSPNQLYFKLRKQMIWYSVLRWLNNHLYFYFFRYETSTGALLWKVWSHLTKAIIPAW